MTNTINTLTFIAMDMLRQVKNNLQFVNNCSNEDLTARFGQSPQVGETIQVRKPARFVGRSGETYSAEDYTERLVSVSTGTTAGADITLTNRELSFAMERISERIVAPAATSIANQLDTLYLKTATQAVAKVVGTPGTIPTALKTYNQARAAVSWMGAPQDGAYPLLITPDMQVEVVDTLKGLFQSSDQIEKQYSAGVMGLVAGSKWYECQNNYVHTVGPQGGVPLINGAPANGATQFVTDAWTAAGANRLKKGDTFTIAGYYEVNPFTRVANANLKRFCASADIASDGAGNATITLTEAINFSGPYQNVSAQIADNSPLTVLGAANTVTPQGLRFHRDAFIFDTLDQHEPQGGVEFCKVVRDKQTGIKIRFIRDWDTTNNRQMNRFDVIPAFGVAYPEWACRIAS